MLNAFTPVSLLHRRQTRYRVLASEGLLQAAQLLLQGRDALPDQLDIAIIHVTYLLTA